MKRARDAFDANGGRDISRREAQAILDRLNLGRVFVRTKGEEKKSDEEALTLAEFFAAAGPAIEAAAESRSTVASAFARLRLKHSAGEVRAAGELAARYASNVLREPGDRVRWRVATDNETFAAAIGRLDGGAQLMRAIGSRIAPSTRTAAANATSSR